MKRNWTDENVKLFWDKAALIYEEENDKVSDTHFQRFKVGVNLLKVKDNDKILNIWCRNGEAIEFLEKSSKNIDIMNAELSANMLKLAKNNFPDSGYVQFKNFCKLPFNNKKFDKVLSLETLEHCPDPQGFLNELYRVTKPGGRLVLSCPPFAAEVIYYIYTFLFGGHGEGPHRFIFSKMVKKFLKIAGWDLLLHKPTLVIPGGPKWMQKFDEKIIGLNIGFINELGIRHFYVCRRKK